MAPIHIRKSPTSIAAVGKKTYLCGSITRQLYSVLRRTRTSIYFCKQRTMNERIVIIDNVDPVVFYGVNNQNMHLLRNLYPKLRIAARGSVIKAIGEENETADFEDKVKALAGTAYPKKPSSTPSKAKRPKKSATMTLSFLASTANPYRRVLPTKSDWWTPFATTTLPSPWDPPEQARHTLP